MESAVGLTMIPITDSEFVNEFGRRMTLPFVAIDSGSIVEAGYF